MSCYADNPPGEGPQVFTTATGSSLGALARLPGSAAGVLDLVPFLKARQGRRDPGWGLETSGWMTGFMMEGLYTAAGEVAEGWLDARAVHKAVEFCHDTLINQGSNSWLGMIRQNATMTMESWTQPPLAAEGGGTFSHPWTAAPAWIIPRFLMGIRPLSAGWATIIVRPLPPKALASASLEVPTQRGLVKLSFAQSATRFDANITIPGNTAAQVCLPRYLFGPIAQCTTTVLGSVAPSTGRGGLQCLDRSVPGGIYTVSMGCT